MQLACVFAVSYFSSTQSEIAMKMAGLLLVHWGVRIVLMLLFITLLALGIVGGDLTLIRIESATL